MDFEEESLLPIYGRNVGCEDAILIVSQDGISANEADSR